MGAHRAGAHQNDRIFSFTDDFACRRDMSRIRIEVMHLLALEGHCVGGHLGNVLGQVDVGGTRLSFFGVLERQPDDLAYRVRADDLFGTLGDGLKHGGQIQILVAGQLHPVGAHLPRDGHQRRTIQISICHARDQVGGTGAQRGQADTGPPGQTAIDIRHKGRALLMTHRNKTNFAVPDGEHQVQCLLARDAEDHIDSLGFQTVYQHLGCRSHLSFLFHSYFPRFDTNAKGSAAPIGPHCLFLRPLY